MVVTATPVRAAALAEQAALAQGWHGHMYRRAWERGFAAGYTGARHRNPYRNPHSRQVWARARTFGAATRRHEKESA